VPVIEGSTHDEFTIFTKIAVEPFFGGAIPAGFYPIVVSILVPTLGLDANPAAVLAQYPLSDYGGNAGLAVSAIGTDAVFACPGRRAARALSQFVPTFAYEFADPNAPQIFVEPASFPYGAYHASELAYLFDSPLRGGHAPFTEAQETLAATMVGYWTQLSKSGSPNGEGTPQWPAYTAANDTYQSLVPPTPVPTTGFAADHKCDFWDAQ
jgi:para-nitrobenzyl esterase